MPRHPRLFLPGAIYHVYCRVARGEFAFDDDGESDEFVAKLRDVRDLDKWSIQAWCLMGNHYHLVVKTGQVELWRSMARLQRTVARGYNRRRGYFGRLWQNRYRARVIDTNEYFRQVLAYVHLNPVMARMVDDPADYRFSGHRELLGLSPPHVVDRRAALRGFGEGNVRARSDSYLEWVRSVAEARWATSGVSGLPWWAKANHTDEIADPIEHPQASSYDGHQLEETRITIGIEEFASRFELASGHALAALASRSRSPALIQARIEFATLAVLRFRLRGSHVARILCKHGNSVTLWLRKGLELGNHDENFKRRLDDIEAAICRRR